MLCVIGMTLTVTSSNAHADDPPDALYELIKLPKGEPKTIDGNRYQCLNFDEFKLLLEMEADMVECEKETDLKSEKIAALETINAQLKTIVALQKLSIGNLNTEKDRLFNLWKADNKRMHEAENKPHLGSWLGWTAAGVATAVLAGFIIQDRLGD